MIMAEKYLLEEKNLNAPANNPCRDSRAASARQRSPPRTTPSRSPLASRPRRRHRSRSRLPRASAAAPPHLAVRSRKKTLPATRIRSRRSARSPASSRSPQQPRLKAVAPPGCSLAGTFPQAASAATAHNMPSAKGQAAKGTM